MSSPGGMPEASVGLVHALNHLQSLGSLLTIADPARWDSVARPSAEDLGRLILNATASVRDELGEIVRLPPA